jgi:hypothetical protein
MLELPNLKQDLIYNPDTGYFFSIRTQKRRDRLDCYKGYYRVFYKGHYYKAHRLAWYYMTGAWPTKQIDHKDENKANNAFTNLRDVSQTINLYNRSQALKKQTSCPLGVSPSGTKFVARIKIKANLKHLGTYPTSQEAAEAYKKYKDKYVETV